MSDWGTTSLLATKLSKDITLNKAIKDLGEDEAILATLYRLKHRVIDNINYINHPNKGYENNFELDLANLIGIEELIKGSIETELSLVEEHRRRIIKIYSEELDKYYELDEEK